MIGRNAGPGVGVKVGVGRGEVGRGEVGPGVNVIVGAGVG